MKFVLEDSVSFYLNEYRNFKDDDEECSAFERLAYLYNYIETNESIGGKKKFELLDFINNSLKEYESFDRVKAGLTDNLERVTRIISVGDSFVDDEITTVLTLMMEVEFCLSLLNNTGNFLIIPEYENISAELAFLESSKANKKIFFTAKNIIKKNLLLPVVSRYL